MYFETIELKTIENTFECMYMKFQTILPKRTEPNRAKSVINDSTRRSDVDN